MSDFYDVDRPYSIDDWNKLVDAVNEILDDPPEGDSECEPIDPLDTVSDPHIWEVSDVEEMQDKLIETCDEISFSEPLEIWKPGIIDEIESAMEQAWCDCCDDEFLHGEEGTEIELFDYEPSMASNCFGLERLEVLLKDVIDGMSIAKSGIERRRWEIWSEPYNTDTFTVPNRSFVVAGFISCEGDIIYTGSRLYPTGWGISVNCSVCNEACRVRIDQEAAKLVDWSNLSWFIKITTSLAECADCDEE